ncbi:MAG: type III-A CRISPR-associated RAMP protein Csm5 [Deltaproteobacteria bacterium]|nr:MAG: type III-A CRISPR-associated RAMP protein Csm5 [Deltaproteobacteria bacterium]
MKTTFRCFVKTLSPVHLGCDEVYEPMGFVMDEQARQMVVFDPASFFAQMKPEDKDRFSHICSQGTIASILEIYKFLRYKKAEGRRIDVCMGFMEDYARTLSISVRDQGKIRRELNQFIVGRTAFSPGDQRPYIPGSAVKGSLRTACLSTLAQIKKVPSGHGRSAAKTLEKSLLDGGAFQTDPFRLVKVSDFMPVGDISTRIVYAVNEKKKPSKLNTFL